MGDKPYVTQLISLLDKPALLKWANKIGLQGIELDQYRNSSKQKGTSLHSQIENCINNDVPFENPEIQSNWDNFISDKEIIDVEKKIETQWFKGRMDIKILYNNHEYICDFKSNSQIYFENVLQLVAYRMGDDPDNMPEQVERDNGINNTRIAIIRIPEFNFIPIDVFDYTPYENILINLSNIYEDKKRIENEKLR